MGIKSTCQFPNCYESGKGMIYCPYHLDLWRSCYKPDKQAVEHPNIFLLRINEARNLFETEMKDI